MSYKSLILGAIALSPAVLSAPLTLTSRSESWAIPSMKEHFMGADSGLPGGWGNNGFNTTLDFTVSLPSGDVSCSGNWTYTKIPTTPFPCQSDGVEFSLGPLSDGNFSEIRWTLSVTDTRTDAQSGAQTTFVGSHEVRGNNPGGPNSYLSCLGGAPLTGIHCDMTGWASSGKSLVLSGEEVA